MTELVRHENHESARVLIAQAVGILAGREDYSLTEAGGVLSIHAQALGIPSVQLAEDVVRGRRDRPNDMSAGSALRARPEDRLVEGLDLDAEVALHEEIKRYRAGLPDLPAPDPATEAVLRRELGPRAERGEVA